MHTQRDWLDELVHDLKTPLTAAKAFVDAVQHLGTLNHAQQEYLEKALVRLDSMRAMIDQLLDMAPSNQHQPHVEVNFDRVLSECIETVEGSAAERGITIYTDIPPGGVGILMAQANQLDKVLLNLLSNAVKYNHDDGSIIVRVESDPQQIVVSVSDTGRGISPQDQDHIFERFYRVKRDAAQIEGTGLGLSIVKAIIHRHGGKIGLQSELNKGTTITFMLPRYPLLPDPDPTLIDAESTDTPSDDPIDLPLIRMPRAAFIDRTTPEMAGEPLDAVDDDLQEAQGSEASDAGGFLNEET